MTEKKKDLAHFLFSSHYASSPRDFDGDLFWVVSQETQQGATEKKVQHFKKRIESSKVKRHQNNPDSNVDLENSEFLLFGSVSLVVFK